MVYTSWKIILKLMTGIVVISKADALMYSARQKTMCLMWN